MSQHTRAPLLRALGLQPSRTPRVPITRLSSDIQGRGPPYDKDRGDRMLSPASRVRSWMELVHVCALHVHPWAGQW